MRVPLLGSRRLRIVVAALAVALFIRLGIEFGTDPRPLDTATPEDASALSRGVDGHRGPLRFPPPFRSYVGSRACEKCHPSIYGSFVETHHYLTSSLPVDDRLFGSFREGENVVRVTDESIYFKMEKTGEGFYINQYLYQRDADRLDVQRKVELVIGSGKIGRTYLYWMDAKLYRMPIGLYQGQWIYDISRNTSGVMTYRSPQPVTPRCLECHATFFEARRVHSARRFTFSTDRYVLTIGCEKCHGPGRAHVEREQAPRPAPGDRGIINPARFNRSQRMELCSQCHSGEGRALQPAFAYTPGQPLDQYRVFDSETWGTHANQAILFRSSECFKKSDNLTCADCHDVHRNERNNLSLHSTRCLGCHPAAHREKITSPAGTTRFESNCIDCHMPLQESTNVSIRISEHRHVYPRIRNHRIGIYE